MTEFLEILKYILPSLVVLAISYLLVKSFLESDTKRKMVDIKVTNTKLITPVKMQAYERLILLLERISPVNLIMRTSTQVVTAKEYHAILLQNLRDEFDHNISQQLYISDLAWEKVLIAKEETIKLINTSAAKLTDDANSTHLASKMLELSFEYSKMPVNEALVFLKEEFRKKF